MEEIDRLQPDAIELRCERLSNRSKMKKAVNAIMTMPIHYDSFSQEAIVELAVKYRLPAIYPTKNLSMRAVSWPMAAT